MKEVPGKSAMERRYLVTVEDGEASLIAGLYIYAKTPYDAERIAKHYFRSSSIRYQVWEK